MEKNTIITAVIVAVVAFGGGIFYQKYSSGATLADLKNMSAEDRRTALSDAGVSGGGGMGGTRAGGIGMRGAGGAGRGANMGGTPGDQFVTGEVLSSDAKSITVKTQDGGSKIIYTSAETKISKSTAGALTDIKTQTQIVVSGTADSSGIVTAKTIQIRDAVIAVPTKK